MRKSALKLMAAVCAITTLTGCGSVNQGSATNNQGNNKETTITVWSWDVGVEKTVAGFEKENPDIKVKVQNVGSGSEQYQQLDNAIQAGSGVPDLLQFEYFALPLFAIPGKLADLSQFGADKLKDQYTVAAWNDVTVNGKTYALPYDYGSLTMFYNKKTFEKAGITEAPKTWDDYYEAAKKIRALGDNYYIVNDGSDIFLLMALIWQAGGRPFTVDGNKTKIDFHDEGSAKAIAFWDKMVKEDLVDTKMSNWSDEWNRGLNDGTLATQINGGWLVSSLPERAADEAGNFIVSPLPQWEEGLSASSELGGSSYAIPEKSENKEAAYKFLEYMTSGDGVQTRVNEMQAFVPNLSVLDDESWQTKKVDFYGDQNFNKTLSDVAKSVSTGWSYPPFMEYGRSIYQDSTNTYYIDGEGNLADAVDAWVRKLVEFGNKQGFEVS